jgi:hypothetical protein
MQDNRNRGAHSSSRRANSVPPVTSVHGLGESHALQLDLKPVQLPWLADEIDTLGATIEEELASARARRDQRLEGDRERRSQEAREADAEVDRRTYQLRVLALIRRQLPVRDQAVAAGIASPWEAESDDPGRAPTEAECPVRVVGPARAMLLLVRGTARNVADALGEALRGPEEDGDERAQLSYALHWPEWHRLTPPVADRLRAMAAAADAFTNTYVDAVVHQSYSFDPEHYPTYPDELW